MKNTLFKCVLVAASAALTANSPARAAGEMQDQAVLQQKLQEAGSKPTPVAPTIADGLAAVADAKSTDAKACKPSKRLTIAGVYSVTYDENGPCRIYDLSFPTLRSMLKTQAIAHLPVQKFSAGDYLHWITGQYDLVYQGVESFNGQFTSNDMTASWVAQLPFKSGRGFLAGRGVPQSFHASDLEIGQFAFSAAEQAQLAQLFDAQNNLFASAESVSADQAKLNQFWAGVIRDPNILLKAIRFDWNGAKKVFDIVLEGNFLPIAGPVTLVDYNVQYRYFVESMTRSILASALQKISMLIPEPISRAVLGIALSETFSFIDDMYAYQQNRLEDTLHMVSFGQMQAEVNVQDVKRGLNILYGQRTNLLATYIQSVLAKKKFDWNNVEKVGATLRYGAEKDRIILGNDLHSKLVLKKGCDVQDLYEGFGICTKANQKVGVYSFMSDPTIFIFDLAPVQLYNYKMPSEVLLKRATSYLLAVGLELSQTLAPLPMMDKLESALRDFASAGQDDEGYLLNRYVIQKKTSGTLDPDSQKILNWLYLQNINPFMPKSEAAQNAVIQVNAAQLEAQ